jgi:hypothetical protein
MMKLKNISLKKEKNQANLTEPSKFGPIPQICNP